MNEPPDHTAVFSAANLLSPAGITEAKYSRKISSCSRSAGVGVEEEDALLLQVLADLVVDDLDSYCAATPATSRCFSASGMPRRS